MYPECAEPLDRSGAIGLEKDIETLLHRLVDTPGNKVQGKVPRDADLNRVLREVLKEHEHTIRDIKRAIRL